MLASLQQGLEKHKWQLFLFFWIGNLLVSIVYKFYYYHTGQHLEYTWLPDLFFLVIFLLAIPPRRFKLVYLGMGFLLLSKAIGSWTLADFYESQLHLYKDILKTWMGYVYVFPLFIFLTASLSKQQKLPELPKFIQNSFVIASFGIALSVFLGVVFKSYVLHTYTSTQRFGFSGVLYPFSYVSYFYMLSISITYLLHKYLPTHRKYLVLLFTLSLAALFSGTKSTYLFLLLFYTLYVVEKKYYKKKYFWLFFSGIMICIFSMYSKLVSVFSVLVDLYEKESFWTFALSYRDQSLQSSLLLVKENWTWVNYLFGGLNNTSQLTELAFVDLFLNFGILGSLAFFLLYLYCILKKLAWTPWYLALGLGILLLIALGGNFLDRIYLAYWLVLYYSIAYKAGLSNKL